MLCLYVPTRWNFTCLMLSVAKKFERAFERYRVMDVQFKYELEEKDENTYNKKRGIK